MKGGRVPRELYDEAIRIRSEVERDRDGLALENKGLRTSLRSAMSDGPPRIVTHTHLGPLAVRDLALSHTLKAYLVSSENDPEQNADTLVAVARKFEAYLTGADEPVEAEEPPKNVLTKPDFSRYKPPGEYLSPASKPDSGEIPTDEQGNLPLPTDQHGLTMDVFKAPAVTAFTPIEVPEATFDVLDYPWATRFDRVIRDGERFVRATCPPEVDFSKKLEPGTYTEAGYTPGTVD